jgi:hypothetical protein
MVPVPALDRASILDPASTLDPASILEGRQAVVNHLRGSEVLAQAEAASADSAVMLVRLRWHEGTWQEQDRGFVVPWE